MAARLLSQKPAMTSNKNLFAAAVLTLAPLAAQATITQAVEFDAKVDQAASIILGKCIRTESRWDDSRRFILTYSTFRVEKSLKGQPAQEVTIVTPGGEVNGEHQDTIGVPSFEEGSEHVLFVKNTRVGPTVLYFDQGAYDVLADGNERVVRPVSSEAVRLDTQRGMAAAAEPPRTLRAFETAVRDSDRRGRLNRMEMIRKQKEVEESSIGSVLARNKLLVLLALAGLALAAWQWMRRS
jgi:hypothetical protein